MQRSMTVPWGPTSMRSGVLWCNLARDRDHDALLRVRPEICDVAPGPGFWSGMDEGVLVLLCCPKCEDDQRLHEPPRIGIM